MNLNRLFATGMLLLALASLSAAAPAEQDVVVTYGTLDNRPVELVYEPSTRRVILRVSLASYSDATNKDSVLEYLKQQVQKIARPGNSVALGNGYRFTYTGGHPIWGPHSEHGPGYDYSCLMFAENARLVGKEITAGGTKQVQGWDGYRLWKPFIDRK